MPRQEDLRQAYANYYTHSAPDRPERPGLAKRVYSCMKRGYWSDHYNYPMPGNRASKFLGKLLRLFPLRRRQADGEVRLLPWLAQGRLLDVGCGSGKWLAFMQTLGWRAEGVDFDSRAVEAARQRGLRVGCGALEDQNFPSESFDAITLNHVIEHLPDPLGTVAECERILKPGGKLVLFTPNSSSLGHRIFKQDWRGLEPPRHLRIFSPGSMGQLLTRGRFERVEIRPHAATSLLYESALLRRRASLASASPSEGSAKLFASVFVRLELCLFKACPWVADCIAVIAIKKRDKNV